MNTYREYPVLGDSFNLLPLLKQTILVNWGGHAYRIAGPPDTLALHDFDPQDKGIPGVYGINPDGYVVCSITLYPGDKYSGNPVEKKPHWQFLWTDKTETAF